MTDSPSKTENILRKWIVGALIGVFLAIVSPLLILVVTNTYTSITSTASAVQSINIQFQGLSRDIDSIKASQSEQIPRIYDLDKRLSVIEEKVKKESK